MNKFTGAESARLLSVLTEAVEKLTLLSHLPYINDSDDTRADVALAQSALLHAFPPPSSASGLYDQQQPSATTVLSQLFAQEDVLLQATDGGKLDLMHDGGGDGGSVAFREAMALARSFCRVVRHDASAHAVLTTVDSHRGSSGGPAQSRNTSSSPNHTGHIIHTHKSTSTNHHRSGLVALSGYVAAVRDQAAGTLSTSVEQDEATRQMMGDMETRIREAENDYKQMTVDVRAQREMRDVDVRRNAHKIHALTNELHDIEQGADQAATLIDQDAKQAEFSLLNGYEGNVRYTIRIIGEKDRWRLVLIRGLHAGYPMPRRVGLVECPMHQEQGRTPRARRWPPEAQVESSGGSEQPDRTVRPRARCVASSNRCGQGGDGDRSG
ncbi:hypothetical protein, variant [Aphanomyces astaci]|uniref:Dynein regulatory complex protein 10 n=2 Tax=Aphanomyces astaci TaxID=112090 RepID=W4GY56_APHAT|nr:hypothetical protein, variant [Aphanomyces astaci]ETV84650.1 hypothetical protein, variant [Aphanomyces astaci]|eukprot:XP_009826342.1 hypothetical protein, variant [Aphanomyces astaci]